MKIEPIAEGRLRVWLKEEEAAFWHLDREEPDKIGLRRLVRRVYTAAGYRPTGRLTAEMVPVAEGWLLLISPTVPAEAGPAVYHLDHPDDLLTLMEKWRWGSTAPQPMCMLYELGEGYRLVVYGDAPLTPAQSRLLTEHTRLVGYGEAVCAHVAEYGTLIADGNALTADGHRPPAPWAPES